MVVTGSHNWSASAENVNDENTVIVHDERIANLFYQEFYARYTFFNPVNVEEISARVALEAFPNPANEIVYVPASEWSNGAELTVELFDMQGRSVMRQVQLAQSLIGIDLSGLPAGMYQLTMSAEGKVGTTKLMLN